MRQILKKINRLLVQFKKFAATCAKCGDYNEYVEEDPNFICYKCRTEKARMFGGDEEKTKLAPQITPMHTSGAVEGFLNSVVERFKKDGLKVNRHPGSIQVVDKNRNIFANLDNFMDHIVNVLFDFGLQGAGPPEKDNVLIYFNPRHPAKQKSLDNMRVVVHDEEENGDNPYINIDFMEI